MKKTVSILLALSLIVAMPTYAWANGTEETIPPVTIAPLYAYITSVASILDIDSVGLSTCYGDVNSLTASSAKLIVTLQQYKDSKWQNYDEWSTAGSSSLVLSKSKYVTSGYKYRVVVKATMYDANGKVLETQSITSPEKSY